MTDDRRPPRVPEGFEYDDASEAYRRVLAGTDSVSTTIALAVAALEDSDIEEVPKLAEVVDPDAMERLFAEKPDGRPREGGMLSFTLAGYEITLEAIADGVEVEIRPP